MICRCGVMRQCHCLVVLSAWSLWTDKIYLSQKQCNNYAENSIHNPTKFCCPSSQAPGICAPLITLVIMSRTSVTGTEQMSEKLKAFKKQDKYTEGQHYRCRGYTINSEGISWERAWDYKPGGWRIGGGSKNVDSSIFRPVYWAELGSVTTCCCYITQ
jgi:hypothetical protein